MTENISIFDFSLSEEEMGRIEALDRGETLFMDHYNPESIDMLFSRFNL